MSEAVGGRRLLARSLRWHPRWPRPHPLLWAGLACLAFWIAVIAAVHP